MKNSVLILLALVLVACSPDEQAAQRDEASKLFAQAREHVHNATVGYNNSAETGKPFDGPLAEYQARELASAADVLESITDLGSPSQQVSAALLLSEVQAARAQDAAAEAVEQWSAQSALANNMVKKLAVARTSQIIADARQQLDPKQLIDDLAGERRNAEQLASQHQEQIDQLQQEIKSLSAQRSKLKQQAEKQTERARKLTARAEEAEGQLRFDTLVQAAEASRQAADASAQADHLTARIDLLESRLAVTGANKTMASARAEQLDQAIADLRTGDRKRDDAAAKARHNANTAAKELVESTEQLAEEHIQNVIQPLDSARADLNAAIDAMSAAAGKDRDQDDAVELALATRRYELAQVTNRYAAILAGYRDLMKLLSEQAVAGFGPQMIGPIREAADLAGERADRLAAETSAALNAAQAALSELTRDADDQQTQSAAEVMLQSVRRQLAATNRAGGGTPG